MKYEVEVTKDKTTWKYSGKRHRVDGPAIEWSGGTKFWYLDGVNYSEADFNRKVSPTCEGKTVTVDGVEYKLVVKE